MSKIIEDINFNNISSKYTDEITEINRQYEELMKDKKIKRILKKIKKEKNNENNS